MSGHFLSAGGGTRTRTPPRGTPDFKLPLSVSACLGRSELFLLTRPVRPFHRRRPLGSSRWVSLPLLCHPAAIGYRLSATGLRVHAVARAGARAVLPGFGQRHLYPLTRRPLALAVAARRRSPARLRARRWPRGPVPGGRRSPARSPGSARGSRFARRHAAGVRPEGPTPALRTATARSMRCARRHDGGEAPSPRLRRRAVQR